MIDYSKIFDWLDEPIEPQTGFLPIIMCVWKRIHLLPRTIDLLNKQTDPNFWLLICDNNPTENGPAIEAALKEARFMVRERRLPENIGGMARFHAAASLKGNDFVIMIDDDQSFDQGMVACFRREAAYNTVVGHWAWRFGSDYWARSVPPAGHTVDYVGTGGMIADRALFEVPRLFDIPAEHFWIEDLWMSYIGWTHGFSLRKSAAHIINGPDDAVSLQSIHGSKKGWMLQDLRGRFKWNLPDHTQLQQPR